MSDSINAPPGTHRDRPTPLSAPDSRYPSAGSQTAPPPALHDATIPTRASVASSELAALTAAEAVRAIICGDVTAESYAQALLRQCEAGAGLNAFISIRPEVTLEAAHECDLRRRAGSMLGRLHGLPVSIKDSINTRQLPTTAGTPALRHFQPREDAPLVRLLRDQGAIMLGKTNMHELSWGYTSNNAAYGAVRNPYDPARIAGGSSGGSAVSVAFRMTPLGVAEDTEGSIRVPAALCGTAGFRPSTGRYPNAATAPTTMLFDQLGPHARSVEDLLLLDAVLTGNGTAAAAVSVKGMRLGLIRPYFWTTLDPEVERVTQSALDALRSAGAMLIEGELPELARLIGLITRPVQFHDFRPTMSDYLQRYHAGLTFEELIAQSSPAIRRIAESMMHIGGRNFVPEQQYQEILTVHLPALRAMYRDYFKRSGVCAIVFPAAILPAPLLQSPAQEESLRIPIRSEFVPFDEAISRNIAPGSTAGLPGLVLPAGLTREGLPVALEFDGPSGSDSQLLSLGLALEAELGRLPPPFGAIRGQYSAADRFTDHPVNASPKPVHR